MKTWKTIPSFTDFEASSDGEIRSKARFCRFVTRDGNEAFRFKKESYRKFHRDRGGYLIINLINGGRTMKVHRLIAEAFLPKFSPKLDVDHIDGNKSNNMVVNIRMATRKENINNPITKKYCLTRARKPNGTFA